jgi:hypothetical protein
MDRVTYQDLVVRYGHPLAFDLLLTIEKLARTAKNIHLLDEDERLQKALNALNNINFSNETDNQIVT